MQPCNNTDRSQRYNSEVGKPDRKARILCDYASLEVEIPEKVIHGVGGEGPGDSGRERWLKGTRSRFRRREMLL